MKLKKNRMQPSKLALFKPLFCIYTCMYMDVNQF